MGDKVRCGTFIFTVLEVEYKSQLGDNAVAKLPLKGVFITIRLSVTNTGGATASLPFLKLENDQGDTITEVEDAKGQEGWLGLFRKVDPGQTETGWIVFDAPGTTYGLILSDGQMENESTEFVKIPVQYPR